MDLKTTGAIAAVGGYTETQLSVGITDLHCNGSEASIFNCSHNNLEQYNCASRDDAGVICQGQYLLSAVIAKHILGELAEQGNGDHAHPGKIHLAGIVSKECKGNFCFCF